ncbi:MAG TPA: hypothetical protein VNS58_23850 [Puia sp.]|nr:hypothetical protein [Puia sp.]
MRNAMVQLCLVLIGVTSVHAVKLLQTSSLHITILPAEEVDKVWAIQGKDSIKMVGIDGEYYLSTVNPGRWQIHVEAKKPYRNASFEEVTIGPGAEKDLGGMKLKK